jgi:tetratricopeptide (TPR) repeat protein/O-antigen ligase
MADDRASGLPVLPGEPDLRDAGRPPLAFRRILRRFSHLLVLTTLAAVPLAYPLHITEQLDFKITRWVSGTESPVLQTVWREQVQPALFSGYGPLTLKRMVWAVLTLALVTTHLLWKLLPSRPETPGAKGQGLSWSFAALLGFVAWSGLSLFLWLPPSEGLDPSRGGFIHGLDAWSDLVSALAFFFLASDLLRRRRWVFKGFGILFGTSALIAVLAVGQRQGWTASFLTRWAPEDVRNRMSSLIGHNTGLASFLMAPTLLSLALGLTRWRRLRKSTAILLAVYWFLLALTLVMSQSRAVLLILAVAVPLLFWMLHRTSGLSPGRKAWTILAGGALLVLLFQVVPASWNPFYDRVSPLTRRVHDLSLERLKAETRVRILLCSIPVIAKNPVFGTGFGSFQYVYPKAQGEYYEENPGTWLVPTSRRTERAHDEYLQTLLETGVVGLGLALAGLILLLRRGWLAFSRTLRPEDIPVQVGLLFAIIAILVHALVDFPFRVAPIAVTLVWMLAVWSAGNRIWLPRRGRRIWLDDDDLAPAVSPARSTVSEPAATLDGTSGPAGAGEPSPPAATGSAPGRWVLWGIAAALVLGFTVLLSTWYTRRLSADVLETRGNTLLETVIQLGNQPRANNARVRIRVLQNARAALKRALVLRPARGDINFARAFVDHYLALEAYQQAEEARKAGENKQEILWLQMAQNHAKSSLLAIHLALSELRYHQVYHLRGEDHRLLARLLNDPALFNRAREDLETAIAYSPAYAEAIRSLISLLETRFPQAEQRRDELLALLDQYNPDLFYRLYVQRGNDAIAEGRYDDAIRISKDLLDAVPENETLLSMLATAYLKSGRLEEAERVLTEMARLEPRPVMYYSISASLAIHRGNYRHALTYINEALRHERGDLDYFRLMKYYTQEKLGDDEGGKGINRLRTKAQRDPRVYVDFADVLIDQFGDRDSAMEFINLRLSPDLPPAPPRLYFEKAKILYEKEKKPKEALGLLETALRIEPDHQPSLQLWKEITKKEYQPGARDKTSDGGAALSPAPLVPEP